MAAPLAAVFTSLIAILLEFSVPRSGTRLAMMKPRRSGK
jgi:hypothetical protein